MRIFVMKGFKLFHEPQKVPCPRTLEAQFAERTDAPAEFGRVESYSSQCKKPTPNHQVRPLQKVRSLWKQSRIFSPQLFRLPHSFPLARRRALTSWRRTRNPAPAELRAGTEPGFLSNPECEAWAWRSLAPCPLFIRACVRRCCPIARPGGARTAVCSCPVPAWLPPPVRILRGRRGVRYGGRRGPSGGGGGGGGGGGKEDGGRGTRVDPRDSL